MLLDSRCTRVHKNIRKKRVSVLYYNWLLFACCYDFVSEGTLKLLLLMSLRLGVSFFCVRLGFYLWGAGFLSLYNNIRVVPFS